MLHYLGVTHHTAPLRLREQCHIDVAAQHQLLEHVSDCAAERLVLVTCERFELYAMADGMTRHAWLRRIAPRLGLSPGALGCASHHATGEGVARQLLRVAAGLESRVLGEPHVLGQVRASYLRAMHAGATGPVLNALGRSAIRAGRRVRSETSLNAAFHSIATVAVDRLVMDGPRFGDRVALLVGTGKLAQDAASELIRRGCRRIRVLSRCPLRADAIAAVVRGVGMDMHHLPRALRDADCMIACTDAVDPVVSADMLRDRGGAGLSIIDLGMPRNVDPAVATVPNVRLIHMDELLATHRQDGDQTDARAVVDEELSGFLQWWQQRRAAPVIAKLLSHKTNDRRDARDEKRRLHRTITRIKERLSA